MVLFVDFLTEIALFQMDLIKLALFQINKSFPNASQV